MSNFEPSRKPNGSVLTGLQRLVIGGLYWPIVLIAGFGIAGNCWDTEGFQLSLSAVITFVAFCFAVPWIWTIVAKGRFRAGFASGILATGASLALLIAVIAASEQTSKDEAYEADYSYGIASASGSAESEDGFAICIEELHRDSDERRSMREEAMAVLVGTASPDLVENAVQDVIIAVCEKFEEGKVELLRPYFFRSVKNQKNKIRRVESRWQYCTLDEFRLPGRPPSQDGADNLRLLRTAMCRIDDRHAYAIRKKADGYSHAWIAEKLEISEAQSRRFVSDGRKELRRLMEEMEAN